MTMNSVDNKYCPDWEWAPGGRLWVWGGGSKVMCSDIGRLVSMEAAAYGETLENVRVHFHFNQNGNLHTRESDTIYRTRISTFLLY
jgi:hypothetical protein